MSYNKDIQQRIDRIINDPAFGALLKSKDKSISLDALHRVMKLACKFLNDNYGEIGEREFLIKLHLDDTPSGENLDVNKLLHELNNGRNVIIVNSIFQLIDYDIISNFNEIKAVKYSLVNKCICIYSVNVLNVKLYSSGVLIDNISVELPSATDIQLGKYKYPASDYKTAIKRFYSIGVRYGQYTQHWKDRKKGILKGGQTEDIFLHQLTIWLKESLSRVNVFSKVNKLSNDETDIEIVVFGGDKYLIEIKWLGKNDKIEYKDSKISEGIRQVIEYLNQDSLITEGTLVVYDGRILSEFQNIVAIDEEPENWKEIREYDGDVLPPRGKGFVFYLVRDTASKRASQHQYMGKL